MSCTEAPASPAWFSAEHAKALAALSADWRDLNALRSATGLFSVAFDGCVDAGVAECRITPLDSRRATGPGRVEYRLKEAGAVA